ncbi:MAG: phosphonate C-P lyase system protein PhnH [Clostridiales bacterium]|nr:phosphonate C-P lyase system protein PhnH [Clostridiales bacterium]
MDDRYDSTMAAQGIFRDVMNAFSHPFKVYNIKDAAGNNPLTQGEHVLVKELCSIFLDNTVSFYVHEDARLAEEIRELTYARPTGLPEAGFVILLHSESFDQWGSISPGSLFAPHEGATVLAVVPAIAGQVKIVAEGPGIDGAQAFLIDPALAQCISRTAQLDIEYPKGYEMLFLTGQGDLCAVPRHVKARKEGL